MRNINHNDYIMTDRDGFIVRKSVIARDHIDVIAINGTTHRPDELTISEDGKTIVVNASQCELTR